MADVVLGVTGCIAAYKAAELSRRLMDAGHEVSVLMTASATRFVAPLTFQALTRRRVLTDTHELDAGEIEHVTRADACDLFLVAPATANTLAKMALGIADDFLSTFHLAVDAPIVVAPGMNDRMWAHPTVGENLATLARRGVTVVQPGSGYLACGHVGPGRMAEPEAIVSAVQQVLGRRRDLAGRRVLVSAGPTWEPLDPVRHLGNRSTGRMGYALANAARERGAEVELVTGPTEIAPPAGVEVIPVVTAAEMHRVLADRHPHADVVLMTAAVADYRPAQVAEQKLKKGGGPMTLVLERTVDILAELGRRKRDDQLLVGFAAETESVESHARGKLERKGLDFIVANDVGRADIGFASDANAVLVLGADGSRRAIERAPKPDVAHAILDCIVARLGSGRLEAVDP